MWEICRKIIRDTEVFLARHLSSGAPRDLVMRIAEEELDRMSATEPSGPSCPVGRVPEREGIHA
jgi:hypothetical protein